VKNSGQRLGVADVKVSNILAVLDREGSEELRQMRASVKVVKVVKVK
jgi:hypothetical protein